MSSTVISVVVVAHNQGPYLVAALDSILKQTLSINKIEVVMVDDASTDATAEIMHAYAEQHFPNAVVQSVDYRNVGLTRQFSLGLISSPYVMFLDGDDLLAFDACESLLDNAMANSADFLFSPVKNFHGDDVDRRISAFTISAYAVSSEKMLEMLFEHQKYKGHLPGCLFSRELIEKVNFSALPCYEDLKVAPDLIGRARCIVMLDRSLYYYRQREGSTSRAIGNEKALIMLNLLKDFGDLHLTARQRIFYHALLVRQCIILLDNVHDLNLKAFTLMRELFDKIPARVFLLSLLVRASLKRKYFQFRSEIKRGFQ